MLNNCWLLSRCVFLPIFASGTHSEKHSYFSIYKDFMLIHGIKLILQLRCSDIQHKHTLCSYMCKFDMKKLFRCIFSC